MTRILLPFLVLTASSLALAQEPAATVSTYEDRVAGALTSVSGGLTADAAAAEAMKTSPLVQIREAEIERSLASQDNTLARYVPQLTLSASVTRNNEIGFDFGGGGLSVGAFNAGQLSVGACADGSGTNCIVDSAGAPVGAIEATPFVIPRNNYSLQAQLNVPISDYLLSLPGARRASKADLTAASARRDDERQRAGHDARIAFYEWLRARAQVAIALESLTSVRARLADAKLNLAGGTIAPADVLQVESLEASSQVAVANAKSFEELARQNLATLMGRDINDPNAVVFSVGEDVLTGDVPEAKLELGEVLAAGQRERADIRGLAASRESADHAATAASAALYPRLDAFANVNHANPNQQFFPPEAAWNTSWSVGLSLSWGLDRFFSARAQKRSSLPTPKSSIANSPRPSGRRPSKSPLPGRSSNVRRLRSR